METIDHGKGIVTIQLNISKIVDEISMLIVNKALQKIEAMMPKGERIGVFDFSIEELHSLSSRSLHILKKNGVLTVADLLKYSRKDLLAMRNMGDKSVINIEEALGSYGLCLRKEERGK